MRDLILTFVYIVALGFVLYRLVRWCECTDARQALDDETTDNQSEIAP